MTKQKLAPALLIACGMTIAATTCSAQTVPTQTQTQTPQTPAGAPVKYPVKYLPTPSFDLSSIDSAANPCNDFYKFACGQFARNHPIPSDQASTDGFYALYNVNTQQLSGILEKAEVASATRTPDEQKIGDYYRACMDVDGHEARGLEPIAPLLKRIDAMGLLQMASVAGDLKRRGISVLFSYGEQQDYKDASKQIASIDQGGLGLPEKDFYLRSGDKDVAIRKAYVAYMTKMLALSGLSQDSAAKNAEGILQFETALAKASMGVTERRDPEKVYHLVPIATVAKEFPGGMFTQFEDAIHSPHVTEINDVNPGYVPALVALVRTTDIGVLRAYMRMHLLTSVAGSLPKQFDDTRFGFYGRMLSGATEKPARWKRCSQQVDSELGEALGKVYAAQYFSAQSKQKMLQMVSDIEHAMDRDLDQLDWMSATTKARAKEKLHGVANKIGYPDRWRDYTALEIKPDDAIGNYLRGNAFENDRQLRKIGQPVDHSEWSMSPPTVNAYYDPSMNDINFPAGILQPAFYDPKQDDAVNYGHIGSIIGHELTHGFDDQGRKFDAKGNLSDWWTPEDARKFDEKTSCVVKEYDRFVAVDDVHVNGKLTLGENTADNGGLVLAYMAYLDRAKQEGIDLNKKVEGYTAAQRFYISYAQNWCSNDRPEGLRTQVLTDPHSPDSMRANGAIVNQPGFAAAFSCKAGTPMVPANSCRVW